jgi:hypothetical protein
MFGSTSRMGAAKDFSFFRARLASDLESVGARKPIEFTHRMRLSRAKSRMMCVRERGSPLQSWLKQRMSRPTRGSSVVCWSATGWQVDSIVTNWSQHWRSQWHTGEHS